MFVKYFIGFLFFKFFKIFNKKGLKVGIVIVIINFRSWYLVKLECFIIMFV